MKKIALLTALSVMSLSTVVTAETPAATAKPAATATAQPNTAKTVAQNATKSAKQEAGNKIGNYKGQGSRSLAQFKRIDKDSNGTISQAEFTASNVEKFNKKDKNKDGNVSPAEFSPTLAKVEAAKKS